MPEKPHPFWDVPGEPPFRSRPFEELLAEHAERTGQEVIPVAEPSATQRAYHQSKLNRQAKALEAKRRNAEVEAVATSVLARYGRYTVQRRIAEHLLTTRKEMVARVGAEAVFELLDAVAELVRERR